MVLATCGAGACVYLPHETAPVLLKQPVSKHGSILLGEMIAIKMVLDFIVEKLHQKMEIKDVLILSDSQSSVGLLTLGWEPTQHKTTSKEILTELNKSKIKTYRSTSDGLLDTRVSIEGVKNLCPMLKILVCQFRIYSPKKLNIQNL